MKSALSILISLICFDRPSIPVERWVIGNKSSLSIEGKTNVSTFKCDIIEYLNQDTILLLRNPEDKKPITVKGGLTLNINRFNCHDNHITSDLKKALKAHENAYLNINLLTLQYIQPNKRIFWLKDMLKFYWQELQRKKKLNTRYFRMKLDFSTL